MMRPTRCGFALLAVLWIMTGVAVLGLGLSLTARGAVATARNRIESTRAGWRAEDCVERARAVISGALRADEGRAMVSGGPWLHLDEIVQSAPLVAECRGVVDIIPAGMAVDLNETTDDALRRLLLWQGAPPAQVDSLVDALMDWRDADDVARAHGAEREWYERQGRSPPRNGAFAHVDELLRVRGFDEWDAAVRPGRDSLHLLFTAEPGRIVLERAPAAVLASLPGMTEETIARLLERRLRRALSLSEPLALGGELSVASRDSLHRHYAEFVQRITLEPEAWLLTVRSPAQVGRGATGPSAAVDLRLVRAGSRAAIVRRQVAP